MSEEQKKIDDGGGAFAKTASRHSLVQNGMFLRDYFAAKAMQGMLASVFSEIRIEGIRIPEDPNWKECEALYISDFAFKIADAMISTRNK